MITALTLVIGVLVATCLVLLFRRNAVAERLELANSKLLADVAHLRDLLQSTSRDNHALRTANKNLKNKASVPQELYVLDGPLGLYDKQGRERSDKQLAQSALMSCADEAMKLNLIDLDRDNKTFTIKFYRNA